ncbi:uncharacterized protein LOC107885373 [Acyrthosiphon pisum]|uniref:Uncharacterized protein n=1 Tax=Acyrthosiphon pisum TaxID=7029 RepID=A0A8R2H9A9_ACYPI|nr:uncharacterized protein LOC107885373 [Acyrthosiphon pisum]|eukprot:XP_016664491.1 PREDICTED: uncharacterized protein LOC107885373 [Acyrthosiphon pisum]
MVRVNNILETSVLAFLIIQIVDASSSGLYYCPMCGFPKYNHYNSLSPTCSSLNYKNDQNSVYPTNTPYPYYRDQNTDVSCLSASGLPTDHIIGSCSDCGRFPYDIQVPPNAHPSPAKLSYPYVTEDPSSPCKQTLQNFGYQLQVPVAHRRDSNYGSLSGIIDKTYKKCPPCPCKLLY